MRPPHLAWFVSCVACVAENAPLDHVIGGCIEVASPLFVVSWTQPQDTSSLSIILVQPSATEACMVQIRKATVTTLWCPLILRRPMAEELYSLPSIVTFDTGSLLHPRRFTI